jgi:hypothetical protein
MGLNVRKKLDKRITVCLDREQLDGLFKIAEEENTIISEVVRSLIDYYLKEVKGCI